MPLEWSNKRVIKVNMRGLHRIWGENSQRALLIGCSFVIHMLLIMFPHYLYIVTITITLLRSSQASREKYDDFLDGRPFSLGDSFGLELEWVSHLPDSIFILCLNPFTAGHVFGRSVLSVSFPEGSNFVATHGLTIFLDV